jgi:2-methylcitrate dehydratase PrpD
MTAASAADAAFANGVASHALDFDDSQPSLRGHPSATMIPAALAVGELTGASGADVLAAYALGLEIAGKLGRALGHGHFMRGWHSTATIGVMSSTAVAARLYELDAKALQTAWGLAASQVAGLVRNFRHHDKDLFMRETRRAMASCPLHWPARASVRILISSMAPITFSILTAKATARR